MNTDIAINHLRKYLKTETDVNEIIIMLEEIQDDLFKDTSSFVDQLNKHVPYELKQILMQIIQESNLQVSNKTEAEQFINHIKDVLQTLPRVELTLAFPPKEEAVDAISEWFMRNFHKIVILKIDVDPSLIGGGIVAFKGEYKDYSIKKVLPNLAVN